MASQPKKIHSNAICSIRVSFECRRKSTFIQQLEMKWTGKFQKDRIHLWISNSWWRRVEDQNEKNIQLWFHFHLSWLSVRENWLKPKKLQPVALQEVGEVDVHEAGDLELVICWLTRLVDYQLFLKISWTDFGETNWWKKIKSPEFNQSYFVGELFFGSGFPQVEATSVWSFAWSGQRLR